MASDDVPTSLPQISAGGLRVTVQDGGRRVGLRATDPATALSSTARGRFWTMSVLHDDQRDAAIHSEEQAGQVRETADGLAVRYDRLVTAGGAVLAIDLTVTIDAAGDDIVFSAHGTAAPGISVRELTLPVLELDRTPGGDPAEDVLYLPEGLGRRIPDPWKRLYTAHTEYMVGDDTGVWHSAAYPGEFSMAWQGLESGDHFLYMGRHSAEFGSVLFNVGVPPRGADPMLALSASTPGDGSRFAAGPVVVSLLTGTWRDGSRKYRGWADEWYTGPHGGQAAPLDGWQRIIMKHQYGRIHLRYRDLVDVYEEGRRHGLDGILLFGWWKQGFDRGYPTYEPDEALGGREELENGIAEIRSRGGWLSLYANGNLIDRTTDYHREHGREIAKKDYRGLDHIVGYDFSDESRILRHFSASSFVIACHGSPRWRETMVDVARRNAELGVHSLFFDQTAYHMTAWPCHDENHEHGPRVGLEARFRQQTLQGIREAGGGATLGSEGMADCMIGLLDFHHGWGFGFEWEAEAFPALFRQTFPEPVVTNRLLHDERDGWQDQLNYAFAYNLAFDVAIHRCRATIGAVPAYAQRVQHLIGLRHEHGAHFRRGHFHHVRTGSDLTHVQYDLDGSVIEVYWNHGDEDQVVAPDVVVSAHDVRVVPAAGTANHG